MDTLNIKVLPSFYTDSPYVDSIRNDLEDDSYGLVFDVFLHDIGSSLHVDIIFDQMDHTYWKIAENNHMEILLTKDALQEVIHLHPKTSIGKELITKLSEHLSEKYQGYINIY